ncbi:tRNA (N6-threonylcarbamoyladenosine(37)-N6)-methyltransferase TrmO [Desulfovibrio sp. JC022]|uniref:tRNA (N6-threonylcarbamoyladenosine(37)-N6)-methyltransferase TrmO n=1 Tax=Desulfovibrio sp. JC022 TaxID=2593642 RepID=UPI0013D83909|nr:tRNA (N6-threonylcarbamoyladenosine(37)-N6)-methyltransferase TrmO [Desulfovibrio sp. JC022]NDV21810.1 tRNA (N6-threonylcarbamoyladenosine(37)-N6)-methyltransferase TrmO [Desulfovibrio sp. JC022]
MNTELKIIGHIHSTIKDRDNAPKQGSEGGVEATVEIREKYRESLDGLKEGADILLFTWFHKADRSYQKVHPRGDESRPKRGVFSTRSPDRPNPIGLHPVTITAIDGCKIKVRPMEAIDGTPLVDIKNAQR